MSRVFQDPKSKIHEPKIQVPGGKGNLVTRAEEEAGNYYISLTSFIPLPTTIVSFKVSQSSIIKSSFKQNIVFRISLGQ